MYILKTLLISGIFLTPILADSISGVVTDAISGAQLAGVAVRLYPSGVSTATDNQGKYSLNTGLTITNTETPGIKPAIVWDSKSGSLEWDRSYGPITIEVYSMSGLLLNRYDLQRNPTAQLCIRNDISSGIKILRVKTDHGILLYQIIRAGNQATASLKSILKSHASTARSGSAQSTHFLHFEKENYVRQVQEITGSRNNVNVSLKSFDLSAKTWKTANLTWYTSHPDPGSEECIEYNGCQWAGYFAGINGQKSEPWVAAHNIAAVHSKDWNPYKHKTLRLRKNEKSIDVWVIDYCSDDDCDGCCSENANSNGIGFLIDIESYTKSRFKVSSGIIEWTCLDCE